MVARYASLLPKVDAQTIEYQRGMRLDRVLASAQMR